MRTLALSPIDRLVEFAPLVVRVIVGLIMAAHGLQKLLTGPGNFGGFLAQLGVPAPTLMGYVVTLVELGGGILLIIGLFSRLAALLLTIDLMVAIVLALIAGFLVILLAGAGRISLDYTLGIERGTVQESRGTQGGRSQAR